MRTSSLLAAAVVLVIGTSAHAVQLVVMSVNSNTGVAGQKAFIIGVKIPKADLSAKGTGSLPTLFAQNIIFAGGVNGPRNVASFNRPDIQSLQSGVIDNAGEFPPNNGDFTSKQLAQIYQDSWWFNSSTSLLYGTNDAAFNSGTITSSNGGAIGPTAAVGITGYVFNRSGSAGIIPTNASDGQTMQYSGLFGPVGSNTLDGAVLGPLFNAAGSHGILTVPLAQIVATGNITLPDITDAGGGIGTFLAIGQNAYDLSGAPAGTNTPAFLDFENEVIAFGIVPEPGAFVLAAIGVLGLPLASRRHRSTKNG